MSRRCSITGKGVLSGNHVSHANNKKKRRFLPNLQKTSFTSEVLEDTIQLRVSTQAIRTIEKNGGIDVYLAKMPSPSLTPELLRLKKKILSKSL